MITVYEIKANGFLGSSKVIDPKEGVGQGWTYTKPTSAEAHKWEHGKWIRMEEPAASLPVPDVDAMAADIRSQRNALLSSCDWTQVSDAPANQPAWAAYRQALRDIPSQPGFPWDVQWPTKPT